VVGRYSEVRTSLIRVVVGALVAGSLALGVCPAHAGAAAVFTKPVPSADASAKVKPSWISVTADDTTPIFAATMTVNGFPVYACIDRPIGHIVYDEEAESDIWVADDYTVARLMAYGAGSRVVNGVNTVVATVTSASGTSSYSWSFIYGSATGIASVTPAADAVVANSPAAVAVGISSPSSVFTSTMKIDGVVVPTTYSASPKTFAHTPSSDLSPGWHAAEFVVRDSSGSSTAKKWSFKVQPPMSTGGECATCHSATPASHPNVDCSVCHSAAYAPAGRHGGSVPTVAGCTGAGTQQSDSCHRLDHANDTQYGVWGSGPFTCVDCHSVDYPAVPRHTDSSITAVHATANSGCDTCHSGSLLAEHSKYPKGADLKYQCDLCHGATASATVKSAISEGRTSCTACHDAMAVHGAVHAGDPAFRGRVIGETSMIPGRTVGGPYHSPTAMTTCISCHRSSNLLTIHLGDNSCPICHGTGGPRASFTAWNKTCRQSECHLPQTKGLSGNVLPVYDPPYTQHDDAKAQLSHATVAQDGVDAQGYCVAKCHTMGCAPSCHTVKDGTLDVSAPITRASQASTDPIVWRLNPADSQSGVAATYYSFDDAPFKPYGTAEVSAGISNPQDTLRIGQHTLKYYSVDTSGNVESTKTAGYVTTGVDSIPPVVVSNGIRSASSVVATSFSLSVADPQSPPPASGPVSLRIEYKTYVRYWEYYAIPTPSWQPVVYSIPQSSWDATTTFSGIENAAWNGFGGGTVSNKGGYLFVIRYRATDSAGNVSTTVEDTVYIDNSAPTTTPSVVTPNLRWRLGSYDFPAGVATTYYRFDGGPFAACTPDELVAGVVNGQPGGTAPGAHSLDYYSVDILGNTEVTKTLTYTLP